MIGNILNKRYRIDKELGRGGMGTVYRAHDITLKRDVALKLLSKANLGTGGRDQLLREARTVANLRHPNIVVVYDAGEHEDTPFLVMELVDGQTLAENKPESLEETIEVAKQICSALDCAHQQGIVHRDLKPENVIVEPDGSLKLMDFGLARSVASRLTNEGELVGTVFYMAPEQALGKAVDARVDLYALGVMLYEWTANRLPFQGEDLLAIITQHLHTPPVPPIAHREDLPRFLNSLIMSLLEKTPEKRLESAAAVLEVLDSPQKMERVRPEGKELTDLDRLVRGRIVGREEELKQATTLWQKTVNGEGQLVMVSGEPGIGKTRLARELVTQAEVSGGRSFTGECHPEGNTPYSAFAQIVRRVLREHAKDGVEFPLPVLADMLKLAPELELNFPHVEPNPQLDPEAEQRRLFEHMDSFCELMSKDAPLLLLLEDLHWADSNTLAMLKMLAHRTARTPVMLLVTYREVEIDAALPFYQLMQELDRQNIGSRIKLERLDKEKTKIMLATIFSEEITPEFLDSIYQETDGNPFFIEEVCKALIESGQLTFNDGRWDRPSIEELSIPQGIKVAIHSRVSRLSEETQSVLLFAAVIGRVFDYLALEKVANLDEDALVDCLEEALHAQLIEEIRDFGSEGFRFSHAMIPFTLRESVSRLRRSRLHRKVAAAIEETAPKDYERLAHHWEQARDPEKGIEYLVKAGKKAAGQYANAEALAYLQRALALAEGRNGYDDILALQAKVLLDVFQGREAARDYKILLERNRQSGDRKGELEALLGLASATYTIALDEPDRASESLKLYEQAYALARELGDRVSMVRALTPTVWFTDYWPEYWERAVANIEEAWTISQEVGDEELIIDSMIARVSRGLVSIIQAEEILLWLEARHDLPRLKQAYFPLIWCHLFAGNFARCVECCDASIDLAKKLEAPPVMYPTLKALALLGLGNYEAAWKALQEEVAEEGYPFGKAFKTFGTGMYLLELMAYEQAAAIFESVIEQAERVGRTWLIRWAQEELSRSLVRSGKLDGKNLNRITRDLSSMDAAIPADVLGEIALRQGKLDEALRQAKKACAEAETNSIWTIPPLRELPQVVKTPTETDEGSQRPSCLSALELRLRVLLQLARPEEVIPIADKGIHTAEEMGYRSLLWRLRSAKAQALTMVGDVGAAGQEHQAAVAVANELADTISDVQLRSTFLSNTSALLTLEHG